MSPTNKFSGCFTRLPREKGFGSSFAAEGRKGEGGARGPLAMMGSTVPPQWLQAWTAQGSARQHGELSLCLLILLPEPQGYDQPQDASCPQAGGEMRSPLPAQHYSTPLLGPAPLPT